MSWSAIIKKLKVVVDVTVEWARLVRDTLTFLVSAINDSRKLKAQLATYLETAASVVTEVADLARQATSLAESLGDTLDPTIAEKLKNLSEQSDSVAAKQKGLAAELKPYTTPGTTPLVNRTTYKSDE